MIKLIFGISATVATIAGVKLFSSAKNNKKVNTQELVSGEAKAAPQVVETTEGSLNED